MSIQAAERITAECEQQTAEIRTVFDKLLFLTSVQKWLGAKHHQLFDEWLASPLEDQYNMLAPHYHQACESGTLASSAFTLSAFSKLIPAGGIEEAPRILFYSNLDLMLEILKESLPANQQTSLSASASLPPFGTIQDECALPFALVLSSQDDR
jgi:hypothetical protein